MGQFCEKDMYLLLEITWDDYVVLHYILKHTPIYVRIDWPSLITRPRRKPRGKNVFTTLFVDITYTHTSNILAFGGTGSTTRRVSFSVWIACKLHADPMIPQKPPKNFSPIFYFLINANPTISPNFMVIGQFLFFGLFGITPPTPAWLQPHPALVHKDMEPCESSCDPPLEVSIHLVLPCKGTSYAVLCPSECCKLVTWNSWRIDPMTCQTGIEMDLVTMSCRACVTDGGGWRST